MFNSDPKKPWTCFKCNCIYTAGFSNIHLAKCKSEFIDNKNYISCPDCNKCIKKSSL